MCELVSAGLVDRLALRMKMQRLSSSPSLLAFASDPFSLVLRTTNSTRRSASVAVLSNHLGQDAGYKDGTLSWKVGRFFGGSELSIRATVALGANAPTSWRKEVRGWWQTGSAEFVCCLVYRFLFFFLFFPIAILTWLRDFPSPSPHPLLSLPLTLSCLLPPRPTTDRALPLRFHFHPRARPLGWTDPAGL